METYLDPYSGHRETIIQLEIQEHIFAFAIPSKTTCITHWVLTEILICLRVIKHEIVIYFMWILAWKWQIWADTCPNSIYRKKQQYT
jgi:hypothetical protein